MLPTASPAELDPGLLDEISEFTKLVPLFDYQTNKRACLVNIPFDSGPMTPPAAPPSAKRKRVVAARPTHDYCRTCRKRRLKCDATRPECRRCVVSGVECEGYSSWEVVLNSESRGNEDVSPPAEGQSMTKQVNPAAMHATQLFSSFLESHFKSPVPAAPTMCHLQRISIPHLCATAVAPPPLLRHAIEAVCLADLARRRKDSGTIEEASRSRGQLLRAIQYAVDVQMTGQKIFGVQSTMAAIVLMSLLPPLQERPDQVRAESSTHLQGALLFAKLCGAGAFEVNNHLDAVFLRQVQFHDLVFATAQRRPLMFRHAEWSRVPRLVLDEDAETYAAMRWIPGHSAVIAGPLKWRQPDYEPAGLAERNLPRDLFVPMPELLHRADNFVIESNAARPSQETLDDISKLVRRWNDVQINAVRASVRESAAICTPMISDDDDETIFDMDIEEHRHLSRGGFFVSHFAFMNPKIAYSSMTLRIFSLLCDCAVLQIICSGTDQHSLPATWTGVSKEEVERRSYVTATEICQHVHFYSQRSLTAARFLSSWITCALNFFDSYCAAEEVRWCTECLLATSMRILRLSGGKEPMTVCPMVDTIAQITKGFCYKLPPPRVGNRGEKTGPQHGAVNAAALTYLQALPSRTIRCVR